MIGRAVLVGRCRDGSYRIFEWRNRDTGGGRNDWDALCDIVDANDRTMLPSPWDIVDVRAALVECVDDAGGPRK